MPPKWMRRWGTYAHEQVQVHILGLRRRTVLLTDDLATGNQIDTLLQQKEAVTKVSNLAQMKAMLLGLVAGQEEVESRMDLDNSSNSR